MLMFGMHKQWCEDDENLHLPLQLLINILYFICRGENLHKPVMWKDILISSLEV